VTDTRGATRRWLGIVVALALAAGTAACSSPASGATGAAEPAPPAVPHPFGLLSCVPRDGIRFCGGGPDVDGKDLRVPSFDGVPLDADVTLPPTGRGPFPLIVLLHGLGESKASWETSRPDTSSADENNVALASNGWAVLTYSARGFGQSCGTVPSRAGTPACADGWIQLADQRYEVRDTQQLAGELVDEGLVRPDIAVSGISYGGGQSLELATLKDRVRLLNGTLVPWTSPVHHVPMEVGGAFAQWAWDDLADALVPNGHLSTTADSPPSADTAPIGVPKLSWNTLLYGVTASNYLAPPGADPSSDLTTWYRSLLQGEPQTATDAAAVATVQQLKSAIGIPPAPGGPAPTAILNGWNDSLFPASEATHYADRVTAAGDHVPLLLELADVGHGWAQNKSDANGPSVARGLAFLDATVRDRGHAATGVVAYATTCPSSAPSGAATTGPSLAALAHGSLTLSGAASQTVTSSGGDAATAAALNPAYAGRPFCQSLPAATEPGTAVYRKVVGTTPVTLLGGATITAHLHVVGDYPQVVGRLWDVSPDGTRQLVSIDVYRPSVNQAAGTTAGSVGDTTMSFDLNPNEYTFPTGDTVELELVGSNAPLFRPSNGTFTVTVTDASVSLPTTTPPAG
jgi:dienelactone hydrolase